MLKLCRYVLTFFSVPSPAIDSSTGAYTNIPKSLTPGKDLVLGDNWSPFDLQVYGSYYESISACELQPQKSKRLYVNGGLLDIVHDSTISESSVIPVPDAAKVVLAPSRTQTTFLYDNAGTTRVGAVSENDGGYIPNGSKRSAGQANLSDDLRTEM